MNDHTILSITNYQNSHSQYGSSTLPQQHHTHTAPNTPINHLNAPEHTHDTQEKKRQVAAPRRHSERTSPPRIDRHNSTHFHSTRSPQQPKHFTKHTKHRQTTQAITTLHYSLQTFSDKPLSYYQVTKEPSREIDKIGTLSLLLQDKT